MITIQFLEVWYRMFQSLHMNPPPPDPVVQIQQGWDQQNDNDKVEPQEEKVVDPSSGSHNDGEQQEVEP